MLFVFILYVFCNDMPIISLQVLELNNNNMSGQNYICVDNFRQFNAMLDG